jgi:muconolactone delta-isomerase
MEFLVEFEVTVPEGTPASESNQVFEAEGAVAARLAEDGHLVRVWRAPVAGGEPTTVALYRAGSEAQLDTLLSALPVAAWSRTTVRRLDAHPFDPARP